MIAALASLLIAPQDPDLTAVRAAELHRTEVIARCARAVCSVMDMASPGGGSGVVFDPAGFVLTNYHVVGEPEKPKDGAVAAGVLPAPPEPPAEELERWQQARADADAEARARFVADWQAAWKAEHHPQGKYHWKNKKIGLPDGELYEAAVLGVDPGSDLAVLRMLPKNAGQRWPYCALGDSDRLLVGETVFAMGNPFLLATDFTPTVTFGIVSGTHRYQEGGGNRMLVYPDCIQVDAPVNPGNSGGPLFDEAGEVVGINGRISIGDRGRVNVGVGFAIASNQIRNFLPDLVAGRHAEHGTLDLSAWYMDAPHDATKRRGVFAQQMYKDSVAAAAGLALGDEITSFNGTRVRSANQLATLVGILPAGAWVSLGFRPMRDDGAGEERTVDVRLSALDTGSSADSKADSERLASRENRRLATRAAIERWTREEAPGAGVTLVLTAPDGTTQRFRRAGARLRIDLGDTVLVRTSPDDCFAVAAGRVVEPTAEQRALLERHLAANPLLADRAQCLAAIGQGLLAGGSHVLGAAAWRFDLPGDGELAMLLFADGSPAGCILRDPVRRAKIELHVRDGRVRVVADGVLDSGWRVEAPVYAPIDDAVFGRPR